MTRDVWVKRCRGCDHTETEHGPGIRSGYDNCKVTSCVCGGFKPCDCVTCQGALGYPPPCEKCDGNSRIVTEACLCPAPVRDEDCYRECPRCQGTGVQP